MLKIFKFICLVCVSLAGLSAMAQDKIHYRGLVELQAVYNDAEKTWLDGGFSMTRHDEDGFPLRFGKLGLHVDYHVTDTLWLRTMSGFYADDGVEAELIESYFHYRPVPRGPVRIRAKLGAFHLPASVENRDLGWTSRFSTTPSVINSWLGEDLRTIGAEFSLDLPGRFRQSPNGWKLTAGLFGYNDANGTILDHRGWGAHDRQNGLFSPLREPTLVAGVKREVYPFYENDDRPGYYLAGGWTYQERFNLQFFHYDNMARVGRGRGGQTGWRTAFNQLAVDWELPRDWTVAGQFLSGNTRAISPVNGIEYNSDFESFYVLVNKQIDKHLLSARIEYYSVDDIDTSPIGFSDQTGRGLMLSWQYRFTGQTRVSAEWLMQDSKQEERRLTTGRGSEFIHQLLFTLQYRFKN